MTIWTGFEGYRDPTEEEALLGLRESLVVLDTNVLLDLYSIPQSARELALEALEFLDDRLFIPHQVLREFWRNRHSVIAEAPKPPAPLKGVRDELLGIVNSLRPDRHRTTEIEEVRAQIIKTLDELAEQIEAAQGEPLDINRILQDNSFDPVLKRLELILEGKIGAGFGSEEETLIQHGRERFEAKIPPGYEDGKEKADQIPERGTGDYLLWEQTLRFVEEQTEPRNFILVTNDSKEDWRCALPNKRKAVQLGVRPELVAEALDRTGMHFMLLDPRDFYRLVNKIRSVESSASRSLSFALETVSENRTRDADEWSSSAYHQLLDALRVAGYTAQADVIVLAAEAGGLALRREIYDIAGYDDDRSLRRFSMPAQRATVALIDAGELPSDVSFPLEAVYDKPGKSIGYEVPDEFVRFATADQSVEDTHYTWIEAARKVAETDAEKVWTVDELVSVISETDLRDVSSAQTPVATLRRDLNLRGEKYFEKVGTDFRLRTS